MKLLLLAGEESGCIYAERIADAVRASRSDVEIRGYADYGFQIGDLAVIGFWAVLRRIGFFLKVKRTMERAIDEWRPDVVCTVDYPGMNLKLAAYAKKRGIRAVHVVCPQVWAWHSGRIPKIEAALDKLCCFFPFEPKLFKPGFAEFVGHPLVEDFGEKGARERGLVAILPGSRIGEIEHHLPTMIEACAGMNWRIPAANERAYAKIVAIAGKERTQLGGARELLKRADCAVVASGTATLEAALAGCPTALVYRVGPVFAFVMRRLIRGIGHLGLANIVAEKAGKNCPMPEFLQADFTAENVRAQLEKWLNDELARTQAVEALAETMKLIVSDGDSMTKIARFLV